MAESGRKYRPPGAGPLQVRDSVRRALTALAGGDCSECLIEASLVEDVERALRCELPDEILACFCNGDDTLRERGFILEMVADHTEAREGGCGKDLVAVGEDGESTFCIARRGDRHRAVWLTIFDDSQDAELSDLGVWLAELADLEADEPPRLPSPFKQLTFWPDPVPVEETPKLRTWRLI